MGRPTADVVVIGAGMAGLSAAHHLDRQGAEVLLIEREAQVGGLCRSIRVGQYTFDYSGHLLCFRDGTNKQWIEGFMDDELVGHHRAASIYLHEKRVPYPIQANLGALPERIMKRCLADYLLQRVLDNGKGGALDTESWSIKAFGEEMCRQFFFPYHMKVWGIPPRETVSEEVSWSIPTPSIEQVINGAMGRTNTGLGYNPKFFYPKRGGIGQIPINMERCLGSKAIKGRAVTEINWRDSYVLLDGAEKVPFHKCISTMPLATLLGLLRPSQGWARGIGKKLRWTGVLVVNLGIRGRSRMKDHWVYFPQPSYPFFRVGSYTSFAPHLSPRGCHSLYVEIPARNGFSIGEEGIKALLASLKRCGLLSNPSDVEVVKTVKIPIAYVVHDVSRKRLLPWVKMWLEEKGIHLAGRYGTWGYGTMEDAMIQGREAAARALG